MLLQFGGKASQSDKETYSKSPNWDGKKFVNLEETNMDISFETMPKILYKQLFNKEGREPKQKLPILSFDKEAFLKASDKAKFIWYGHSVVLLRMNDKTILIDPMLGNNAAPVSPFSVSRFSNNSIDLIDQFPDIDLVLLTHDHYDHLDFNSIIKLKAKVKKYFVAMGVKRHLVKWGMDAHLITEFDWWDAETFSEIRLTFTPSRHFSGRGLRDRSGSLWGGWILKSETENIWFSGDGGYGKHFKTIGDNFGPFDFAFVESGQYNQYWHQIHMYPEESVNAAEDGKALMAMPVHWAGFALSQHPWQEPAERFVAACHVAGQPYTLPRLGELVTLGEAPRHEAWWGTH